MKKLNIKILAAALGLLVCAAATEAHSMKNALDPKQESIVAISALSGAGELDKLKPALKRGLESGLTVNEIKELLVQVYAYAGFPRSLNALGTFRTVLEERRAEGIIDAEGRLPGPPPADRSSLEFGTENQTRLIGQPVGGGLYDFAPAIDQYLKAHLFGDIFQRDNLDWKRRELATVAILAGIPGVDPQLRAHLAIGMRNGLSADELEGAAKVIGDKLGRRSGENVSRLLADLLKQ